MNKIISVIILIGLAANIKTSSEPNNFKASKNFICKPKCSDQFYCINVWLNIQTQKCKKNTNTRTSCLNKVLWNYTSILYSENIKFKNQCNRLVGGNNA